MFPEVIIHIAPEIFEQSIIARNFSRNENGIDLTSSVQFNNITHDTEHDMKAYRALGIHDRVTNYLGKYEKQQEMKQYKNFTQELAFLQDPPDFNINIDYFGNYE